jgi:hypothetical protein
MLQAAGLQSLPDIDENLIKTPEDMDTLLGTTKEQVSNLNSHLAQVTTKNARTCALVLQKLNPANDPSCSTPRR